jgi:hypothetical protein
MMFVCRFELKKREKIKKNEKVTGEMDVTRT